MNTPRVGLLYPGDAAQRERADPHESRFAPLFATLAQAGVAAEPVIYDADWADELRPQILGLQLLLVWQNPLDTLGRPRDRLDALLREAAAAGVRVSAHPDVIRKLGRKDVLLACRNLPFGSDCHRIDSLAALRPALEDRLRQGPRVLKQAHGHSGIGVWRVQAEGAQLRLRHAQRGSVEEISDWDGLSERLAPLFANGGHLIDQAWQPGIAQGMTRAYFVGAQLVGFGQQAINALHPLHAQPGARLYHPAEALAFQPLKARIESEDWVGQLCRATAVAPDELPLLWDADFIPAEAGWVLCEANLSSVAPFPDSAIAPLVAAARSRL